MLLTNAKIHIWPDFQSCRSKIDRVFAKRAFLNQKTRFGDCGSQKGQNKVGFSPLWITFDTMYGFAKTWEGPMWPQLGAILGWHGAFPGFGKSRDNIKRYSEWWKPHLILTSLRATISKSCFLFQKSPYCKNLVNFGPTTLKIGSNMYLGICQQQYFTKNNLNKPNPRNWCSNTLCESPVIWVNIFTSSTCFWLNSS